MNRSIADLRQDYTLYGLVEENCSANPFDQFELWLSQALNAQILEPNAMTLATVNAKGHPSARIVLLKGFDYNGFVFHTNYNSAKGQDIANHPWVSLVFWWGDLERQVRVEGKIEKASPDDSNGYFASRPIASQIGAWASNQSQVVSSREQLEKQFAYFQEKFKNEPITRPPHWGGYRVIPSLFEFWQGRRSRLHDRLVYSLTPENEWLRERLSP
jgi:pyridoxamine 5'-phosphate oxidase